MQDHFNEILPLLYLSLRYSYQSSIQDEHDSDPYLLHLHNLDDFIVKDENHEYIDARL